jgi:hypothetical protein
MKTCAIGLGIGLAYLFVTTVAHAGCIGPMIMGVCHGTEVPWDTHTVEDSHPDPPPGFYYDWRGTREEQRHFDDINPFTGRDAHDSHWGDPEQNDE